MTVPKVDDSTRRGWLRHESRADRDQLPSGRSGQAPLRGRSPTECASQQDQSETPSNFRSPCSLMRSPFRWDENVVCVQTFASARFVWSNHPLGSEFETLNDVCAAWSRKRVRLTFSPHLRYIRRFPILLIVTTACRLSLSISSHNIH